MKTIEVPAGAHHIEISMSFWTGKHIVRYDGEVHSEKRDRVGLFTIHSFEVQEEGERVVYEVNCFPGLRRNGFVLRRKGVILAHEP